MLIDFERRKPLIKMAARMADKGLMSKIGYIGTVFMALAETVREARDLALEASVVMNGENLASLRLSRKVDDREPLV